MLDLSSMKATVLRVPELRICGGSNFSLPLPTDPSTSGAESDMVTLRIFRKYKNPVTGRSRSPVPVSGPQDQRPPGTGVLGGSDNGRSRCTGHRSGPGGLTCDILCRGCHYLLRTCHRLTVGSTRDRKSTETKKQKIGPAAPKK